MAKRDYLCQCGIFCKTPTYVSKTTWYAHRKLAPDFALPQYEPVTPGLTAIRNEVITQQQEAINQATRARKQKRATQDEPRKRVCTSANMSEIEEDLGALTSPKTGTVSRLDTDVTTTLPAGEPFGSLIQQLPPGEFVQGSSRDGAYSVPEAPSEPFLDGDRGCLDDIAAPPSCGADGTDTAQAGDDVVLPEDEDDPPTAHIEDLRVAQQFIDALKVAGLADGLHPDVLARLRSPPQEVLNIEDKSLRFSLEVFLSLDHASDDVYNTFREANARIPENIQLLSLDQVKRKVQEMSGIYPVYYDMCVTSCVAFTGPFAELSRCPLCRESRHEPLPASSRQKPKPRKQFLTIPIGPQIQAAWRSPESAAAMRYRKESMAQILASCGAEGITIPEYDDWIHGSEAIQAALDGDINEDSSVLMLSLDGAQLYRMKQSDCWIYIWVLLDRHPSSRYKKKHVLIGGVIPGPHKPKNIDSFLFPGLAHFSALVREGLPIWDASTGALFRSTPFLAFVTADGPGLSFVNGLVGHSGRYGCRLYCPVPGRHKPGTGHYYPALLKPIDSSASSSSHDDVSLRSIDILRPVEAAKKASERYRKNLRHIQGSTSLTQYEKRRLETGIARPTLLRGLPTHSIFGIPQCFVGDVMHAGGSTLPDLLISLWRATIKCDPSDDKRTWEWAVLRDANTWKRHGALVAAVTPYLPGSFDRPPRNPAEKINSGYKAVEFIHYLFGVGPALLYGVLPFQYWHNYCRLVRGWRLMNPPKRKLTPADLKEAHKQFVLFLEEFEQLYFQRKPARLHFVRQSLHGLAHLAPEAVRVGPPGIYSQWTMERVIGDLGSEMRQPSNTYANLSQRALRRCQVNAIKHMVPGLGSDISAGQSLPRHACRLPHGYALLHATEDKARVVRPCEAVALRAFIQGREDLMVIASEWLQANPAVQRWARLRLPNGSQARSAWKESSKPLTKLRTARMVKLSNRIQGRVEYAEVLYYFKVNLSTGPLGLAMVSIYSEPNTALLSLSFNVVSSQIYRGDEGLAVIDVTCITAALALPPQPVVTAEMLAEKGYPATAPTIEHGMFYAYEKSGEEIDSFRDSEDTHVLGNTSDE